MDRWKQYLFESHSESTIRKWARQLRYFRFFRAFGGHAGDNDSFDVFFRYDGVDELNRFFEDLGVTLIKHTVQPPQPVSGVSYQGDEFAKFPSLIRDTTWIEQPGRCKIAGQDAFAWCDRHSIKISVGQGWEVSEADVASAQKIESVLEGVKLERVDPPIDSKNCVCPKYYPEYFD